MVLGWRLRFEGTIEKAIWPILSGYLKEYWKNLGGPPTATEYREVTKWLTLQMKALEVRRGRKKSKCYEIAILLLLSVLIKMLWPLSKISQVSLKNPPEYYPQVFRIHAEEHHSMEYRTSPRIG